MAGERPFRPCSRNLIAALLIASLGCEPETPPGPVGVTTWQDAPLDFVQDCPQDARQGGGSCSPDTAQWFERYDAFFEQPETIAASAPRADCESLPADLWAIRQTGQSWAPAFDWPDVGGPEGLGRSLWDAVHMGWLLDTLPTRDLDVFVLSEEERESPDGTPYRQLDLVMRDRFAGDVPAVLLLPRGEGPFPGVVALTGHAEDAVSHVERRFGARFPERGMALLVPSFRAYQQGDWPPGRFPESEAALRFLCQGMNLMAMRVYEAMLGLRALGTHEHVRADRLGVLGHSGGSTTAHLLLWHPDVEARAWVLDNGPAHFGVDLKYSDDPDSVTVDCGVHQWLDAASSLIADVCRVPEAWEREVLRVPYAYNTGAVPVEGEPCATWPWEPMDAEPAPEDPDAPEWFLPFFEQRLGAADQG